MKRILICVVMLALVVSSYSSSEIEMDRSRPSRVENKMSYYKMDGLVALSNFKGLTISGGRKRMSGVTKSTYTFLVRYEGDIHQFEIPHEKVTLRESSSPNVEFVIKTPRFKGDIKDNIIDELRDRIQWNITRHYRHFRYDGEYKVIIYLPLDKIDQYIGIDLNN